MLALTAILGAIHASIDDIVYVVLGMQACVWVEAVVCCCGEILTFECVPSQLLSKAGIHCVWLGLA